ncbi:hypothetical protein PVAP13_J683811 [Panicum virgatum]|nr:hypothetical protein PVAP13_J683811 [Panicum virgatum]
MRTQTRRLPPRASSRRRTRGDDDQPGPRPTPQPPALPRPLKPCGPARHRREHARRQPEATVHDGRLHQGPPATTSRPTGTTAPPGACQPGPGSTGAQGSTATPIAAARGELVFHPS